MEDNENWRARRAAELIGTPFERPRESIRDRMDETLPIQRPEPAVFATGQAAGRAAPPLESLAPLRRRASLAWWVVGIGALVLLVAIVVASRNRKLPVRAAAVALASTHAVPPTIAPPVATPPNATVPAAGLPVTAPPEGDQSTIVAGVPDRPNAASPRRATLPPTSTNKTAIHVGGDVPATHSKPPAHQSDGRAKPNGQHPPVLPIITVSVPRCTGSSSRVETAICDSPTLTALDRQMRELSAGVIADGDQRLIAKAQKGEGSFIKKRERCKDDACISRVYAHRIEALQKLRKKAVVEQARAAEKALPICGKGEHPSPTTCRHRRFSLKRLLGG